MKNLILAFFILLSSSVYGNLTNPANPIMLDLVKAIVYQEGAQLGHTKKIVLKTGQHTLEFIDLPEDIVNNSLQVSLGTNVVIESIDLQKDVTIEPKYKHQIDSFLLASKILSDSIILLQTHVEIFQSEKEVIAQNSKIKATENITASDVSDFADFYRKRRMEIESLILELKYKKEDFQKRIISYQQEIAKIKAVNKNHRNKLVVKYTSASEEMVEATLSYMIKSAGWTPDYDIRVESTSEPLAWVYKAKVFQNSGIDWQDVELAFATGYPSANLTKPVLSNYLLTPHNYYTDQPGRRPLNKPRYVSGTVMDVYGESLIGANIVEQGTDNGTVSDVDGKFSLKLTNPGSKLNISYTGYESKIVVPRPGDNIFILEEGHSLDEVVVADGFRLSSFYKKEKKKVEYQIPLAIKKNVTQRLFELTQRYSIKSNASEKSVTLLTYNIDCNYRYEVVPKVEEKAYLVALIKDWFKYEFLSGNINIYFNGIYQGNSFLDLQKEKEELVFSIGVDTNIKVKRNSKQDYNDENFFGDKVTSKKTWEIELHNGHPFAAEFVITDQIPKSKSDKIKVEVKELSNGMLNEDTGMVEWKMNISEGSTETLQLTYHVTSRRKDRVIVE